MDDDYTVSISLRMPVSLVKKLDSDVSKKYFATRSEAINILTMDGRNLREIKKANLNPESFKNACSQIDEKRKNETMAGWFSTLDNSQQKAIIDIFQLVRDGKWTQTELTQYE